MSHELYLSNKSTWHAAPRPRHRPALRALHDCAYRLRARCLCPVRALCRGRRSARKCLVVPCSEYWKHKLGWNYECRGRPFFGLPKFGFTTEEVRELAEDAGTVLFSHESRILSPGDRSVSPGGTAPSASPSSGIYHPPAHSPSLVKVSSKMSAGVEIF